MRKPSVSNMPAIELPSPSHMGSEFAKLGTLITHLVGLKDILESKIQQAEIAIDHALSLEPEKGEQGDTVEPDEEGIIAGVLKKIPKPEDGKDADEMAILEKVLRQVPKIENIIPAVLERIPTPKDGDTPIVTFDMILEALANAPDDKKIKIKHIAGLETSIAEMSHQLAGKIYGKNTTVRGGGDSVIAGTNVTVTRNGEGKTVISASGGGASSPLTPIGTVNGTNTVFGVASQPSSVVADGITYFENSGYTYVAGNITMTTAPSQYIRYYA